MKNNVKLAAAVALVMVAAGCQVKAPSTVEQEGTIGGKAATGKSGATGAQAGLGSQTGKAGSGATGSGSATVGAGATTGTGSAAVSVFDPAKMPTGQQALVGANGMALAAQTGGMYRSADGSLTADIPPGALSQDATIKIARIDTTGVPASDYFVPGIQFAVDLGGAKLAPDTQIMVKALVDDRFVDEMKQRDAAFDPNKYSLSQVDGKWYMSMAVKGPSSTSITAPATQPTLSAWNLNEYGGFPQPAAPTASQYSLQFIAGSYDYDDEEVRLTNGQIIKAPKTTAQWSQMESQGIFGCGAFPHCYYYGKLVTRNNLMPQRNALVTRAKALRASIPASDLAAKVKSGDTVTLNSLPAGVTLDTASDALPKDKALTLGEKTADTGASVTFKATAGDASGSVTFKIALTAAVSELYGVEDGIRALDAQADAAAKDCNIVVTPSPIKTHTTWLSDDDSLKGKDALGVGVHFQMLMNPVSGPADVNSDLTGAANTFAQAGTAVTISPSFTLGGKTVGGAAVPIPALLANQPTVELQVAKYSPKITLTVSSSEQALSGNLTVKYTIDGTEASQDLAVSGAKATVSFYAKVADDKTHTFQLTSVTNSELNALKLPDGLTVQRNGEYAQSVALTNVGLK